MKTLTPPPPLYLQHCHSHGFSDKQCNHNWMSHVPNNQSGCNKLLRSCTLKILNPFYSKWFGGEKSALKYSLVLHSSPTVLGYTSFATTSKTYLTQSSTNSQIKSTTKNLPKIIIFYCIKQTPLTDDLL